MDARSDIREFLASRRATITPEQVGLPTYGGRRVPGLRREEVAVVAGVSVPYYTRLERGDLNGVSDSVLDALAGAQQLDDAERAHLVDLARAAQPAVSPRRRRQAKEAGPPRPPLGSPGQLTPIRRWQRAGETAGGNEATGHARCLAELEPGEEHERCDRLHKHLPDHPR